ncbi:MAG: hypothetical protein GXO76_00660 [Calditrichaeota bacterium]|nr:hypothetical protein [Calditrichota bacterium]
MSIRIKSGTEFIDELYPRVKGFLEHDTLDLIIDGQSIRGYRSPDSRAVWIRDYSDMMRGFKYFETDLKSTVAHFAETQAQNGRIFDYFTTFPEKLPCERENWAKYVRVPVEADVEYRFVKAAYQAWQATGDDAWMETLLPHLEKALGYVFTHPWRWDETHQLVKRAYTIDTWDFAYTAGQHDWLQFQIDPNTFWGIFHGDNSGTYEAGLLLARLYEYFDQPKKSNAWIRKAESLKNHLNKVCWNGRFYTHFVKLTPVEIPGVDEAEQLSLSNPMAINRNAATHDMAVSIIREYLRRKEARGLAYEWFSIDPPFPDGLFGDEKLVAGAYINGGIFPLAGGELARAAFEHGFEWYGVDILRRYYELIAQTGETYLWYFPDGRPSSVETSTSPEAMPTDGWGSSAMLYALVEGLAGVQDRHKQFETVGLSPRWPAAGISEADVEVGYDASGAGFRYTYHLNEEFLTLNVEASQATIDCHVLLPEDKTTTNVTVDGKPTHFNWQDIEMSRYVDFKTTVRGKAVIRIHLKARD